jgi:two-component system OmpR family response regulator
MDKPLILIADDEPDVCELISLYLEKEGYETIFAYDGLASLEIFRKKQPDLVILDIMMPKKAGWEVCREIRKESTIPIIMLTAKGQETDKIQGLNLGADDYVTKPFSSGELVARVNAVLRRSKEMNNETKKEVLHYPNLIIDRSKYQVQMMDQNVAMPPKEFELLWLLASHEGRVYTREMLLEQIWGFDYPGDTRTVDVHIKRVREKLETEENSVRYIHTVWGVGYKFEVEEK